MTENLVALKEIRLEHEEGAPCTAIREGIVCTFVRRMCYELYIELLKPKQHDKSSFCVSKRNSDIEIVDDWKIYAIISFWHLIEEKEYNKTRAGGGWRGSSI